MVNGMWIWSSVFFYSARIILLPKWFEHLKNVHLVECSSVFAASYALLLYKTVFHTEENYSVPLSATLQVLLDLASIYAIY